MVSFENLGVVSIGEMGLGIAQVLIAHGYQVHTYAADRRYTFSVALPASRTMSKLIARMAALTLSRALEMLVYSYRLH
jgi:3-hydroxyacyl-CoA dehydrogenase